VASADIERILADDYLADLTSRSIEDVRVLRAECTEVELGLSYQRRLLHGRLDIVHAELERRARGEGPGDVATLVEQLPQILADRGHSSSNRLISHLSPGPEEATALDAEIDAVADFARLSNMAAFADAEVQQIGDALAEMERAVSDRRRAVLDRLDALQAELTRRYKSGEASVESLLS
jgi:hypothetical protein